MSHLLFGLAEQGNAFELMIPGIRISVQRAGINRHCHFCQVCGANASDSFWFPATQGRGRIT